MSRLLLGLWPYFDSDPTLDIVATPQALSRPLSVQPLHLCTLYFFLLEYLSPFLYDKILLLLQDCLLQGEPRGSLLPLGVVSDHY